MTYRTGVGKSLTRALAIAGAVVLACVLTGTDGLAPRSAAPKSVLAAPLSAPDNSITLQPFLSGFSNPVFMTHAGDGSGRLFVVEQGGRIKVVANGQTTTFLDLSGIIQPGGEQGLLGLAFHPQYKTNRRFFVYYTAKPPPGVGNNTLVEYRVTGNPLVADPTPVRTLFSLPDAFTNHNGGNIAFSPSDGYLYVGTGDEGGGGDPNENAQNLNSLYGKMLRLDVDNIPGGSQYGIPPTNPFVGQSGVREEIWAYGFRNPWRWSFDRGASKVGNLGRGDLYVGDVGQGAWEEVDWLPRAQGGINYGWDDREGAHCYEPMSGCLTSGRVNPILEYSHSFGCSITGGYVYRGAAWPSLQGTYFYGDFCSGRIWKGLNVAGPGSSWQAVEALDTNLGISAFAEDESGELFVLDLGGGTIYRILPAQPQCSARPQIAVSVTRTGVGTLTALISATDSQTIGNNTLQSITFARLDNAYATFSGMDEQRDPFAVPLAAGTRSVVFTARRDAPGPFAVHLSITDQCGPWSTFVGGGTSY